MVIYKIDIRTENWDGYEIRFVEIDNEWWAVLGDICKALGVKTYHVKTRLDKTMLKKISIEIERNRPKNYGIGSNEGVNYKKHNTLTEVLLVNEIGVYETLFASRKPEARKFRLWTAGVLKKLRGVIGLQGYESLKLTDEHYQAQIDDILDRLYYDEEKDAVMISKTIAGGDVEQVLFYAETINPVE